MGVNKWANFFGPDPSLGRAMGMSIFEPQNQPKIEFWLLTSPMMQAEKPFMLDLLCPKGSTRKNIKSWARAIIQEIAPPKP